MFEMKEFDYEVRYYNSRHGMDMVRKGRMSGFDEECVERLVRRDCKYYEEIESISVVAVA